MTQLSTYHSTELTWFLRDGLPEFEGGSTMGPILEATSLFARKLAQQYARERGYSIYPLDDETARPGPRHRNAGGHEPDADALARGADVTRVLRLVAATNQLHHLAIVLHFGRHGDGWMSVAPRIGRLGALYVLTASGQRLLNDMEAERIRLGQPDRGYHPSIRLYLEVARETTERDQSNKSPKRWRRDFQTVRHHRLLRMPGEASALLRSACATWNEVVQRGAPVEAPAADRVAAIAAFTAERSAAALAAPRPAGKTAEQIAREASLAVSTAIGKWARRKPGKAAGRACRCGAEAARCRHETGQAGKVCGARLWLCERCSDGRLCQRHVFAAGRPDPALVQGGEASCATQKAS